MATGISPLDLAAVDWETFQAIADRLHRRRITTKPKSIRRRR